MQTQNNHAFNIFKLLLEQLMMNHKLHFQAFSNVFSTIKT